MLQSGEVWQGGQNWLSSRLNTKLNGTQYYIKINNHNLY
jgi:hypothetical protein